MWFFRRTFWGLALIFLGIVIILNNVFGINFPFWGVFWSVVIIGIGLSVLTGSSKRWHGEWRHDWNSYSTDSNDVVFGEGRVEGTRENKEYNSVFGRSEINLTKIKLGQKNIDFKVNAVFGSTLVIITKGQPYRILSESAFGSVDLPNGQHTSFGSNEYRSDSFKKDAPSITIFASAVFGSIKIIEK